MGYCPYGGARQLWQSKDSEILIDGPAGTGKTRSILEKCHLMAMKYPGARILLTRKTRASMTHTVLVTLEEKVMGDQLSLKSGARRSHRDSYRYPNGSELICIGMDNAERIMSLEIDAVYCCEATELTEDDWEKLLTRLRNGKMPYQQAIADCNPSYPRHWLKVRADEGRMKRIISRHEDNPAITSAYLDRLSKLSGHRRERLFKGNWTSAEGLVYDNWDAGIHVCELDEVRVDRAIISIDEGYTNPCAVLVLLADNDGRVHIKKEWCKTQQLETQVVAKVQELSEKYNAEAIIADPSAKKLIEALKAADLHAVGANNDVFGGIQTIQNMLEVQGDGRPRLTVDPSCTSFIDEIESYQWKENRDGSKEDKPVKQNDHCQDSARYGCMYLAEHSGSFEAFAV